MCHANANCTDSEGSFECHCISGYRGDGFNCTGDNIKYPDRYLAHFNNFVIDIDECSEAVHSCDSNANCSNTEGTYTCMCTEGYHGDGFTCNSE